MPPTSYKTACNTYFSVALQNQSHLKKKEKNCTRKSDNEDDLPIDYNEKMFKNYREKLATITDEYCNRKDTRKIHKYTKVSTSIGARSFYFSLCQNRITSNVYIYGKS